MTSSNEGRRVPRFVLVGMLAALVHWSIANLLMLAGTPPLLANAGGFALAFVVSYQGQRNWTFGAGQLPHSQTLPRYLLLASAGFACNELLFYLLLQYTPLPKPLALALVLLLVAAGTYLLSRGWVFKRR